MANIFNKTNQLYENPNRNTFQHDHSFHGTFNFGDLYPVLCKEVIPGTSVSINPTIALKMMPMLFPIQSRIKAYLHFFYVPYRTLWKDWMDFIGDTKKGLNKPFINPEFTEIKTGSLADYLGLPTTIAGFQNYKSDNKPLTYDFDLSEYNNDYKFKLIPSSVVTNRLTSICTNALYELGYLFGNAGLDDGSWTEFLSNYNREVGLTTQLSFFNAIKELHFAQRNPDKFLNYFLFEQPRRIVVNTIDFNLQGCPFTNNYHYYLATIASTNINPDILKQAFIITAKIRNVEYLIINPTPYYSLQTDSIDICLPTWDDFVRNSYIINSDGYLFDLSSEFENLLRSEISVSSIDILTFTNQQNLFDSNPEASLSEPVVSYIFGRANNIFADKGVVDISELTESQNPYFDFENIKIDAGPFRAYESIYNTYYRDDRNNPRIVNGEPVYNKFIPNDEGGIDDYPYKLHQRNWEQDHLTLSVQSPQQGIAPLVGITSRGEFQFKDEENGRLYTAQANYSSDGDTIESFTINSADMPKSSLRQLMTYATEGISISDLRNVNALQRWLEINMRRGYRYKDQIKSHFGVDVRYDELMMPEFIGGMSSDVFVNQINNTAQSDGNPLGAFAGQGSSIEKSNNTIHHYCQEHGYIIGILSLSPTANYSQLLPKHFTKREILDYYFPEFGHIGFQPIPYREVAPLSAYLAGKSLDDTFGYQRAWYDYLASNDSVHGLFRTSLKNFVVQRIFNSYPELSPEFLTIDHKDLDDIFAVESSDVSHKFFGEIFFDMKMKLPIPEYGTPKLEV